MPLIKTVYLREPMNPKPFKTTNPEGISTSILEATDVLGFEDGEDAIVMFAIPDTGLHRRIPNSSIKWVDYDCSQPKAADEPRPSPETSSGSKKKTGKQK